LQTESDLHAVHAVRARQDSLRTNSGCDAQLQFLGFGEKIRGEVCGVERRRDKDVGLTWFSVRLGDLLQIRAVCCSRRRCFAERHCSDPPCRP
jgi:hypothetical protein